MHPVILGRKQHHSHQLRARELKRELEGGEGNSKIDGRRRRRRGVERDTIDGRGTCLAHAFSLPNQPWTEPLGYRRGSWH